jgi:hypothetical protein
MKLTMETGNLAGIGLDTANPEIAPGLYSPNRRAGKISMSKIHNAMISEVYYG